MFTGIIEKISKVIHVKSEAGNKIFYFENPFEEKLTLGQSIAHNGICLTVSSINKNIYSVVAINETLKLTNLNDTKEGDWINIERCLKVDGRFDGHIVQGHIDCVAIVKNIAENDGSKIYYFEFINKIKTAIVKKGSICVNGVSLTVVDDSENNFCVAIIPFTSESTNFQYLKVNDTVNIEFDILGKYILKYFNQ